MSGASVHAGHGTLGPTAHVERGTHGPWSGPVHEVLNPATEEVVASVRLATVEQADDAVARAVRAGPAWRAVAP
ncbi:MAG: aldehyde dehydrogenase family protein, partial [Phycicoccus sp.]